MEIIIVYVAQQKVNNPKTKTKSFFSIQPPYIQTDMLFSSILFLDVTSRSRGEIVTFACLLFCLLVWGPMKKSSQNMGKVST